MDSSDESSSSEEESTMMLMATRRRRAPVSEDSDSEDSDSDGSEESSASAESEDEGSSDSSSSSSSEVDSNAEDDDDGSEDDASDDNSDSEEDEAMALSTTTTTSSSSSSSSSSATTSAATMAAAAADDDSTPQPLSAAEQKRAAAELARVKREAADASFLDLGLSPWLEEACGSMGMRHPTPVQYACVPQVLAGRDIIACAETGSGKTAAFALPIMHDLAQDPYGIFAVVLTPTRELAFQIAEQFHALGAPMKLREAVVIGGLPILDQSIALAARPHVVIATPGRFAHLIRGASAPRLSKVKYLVLDEADRLLEISFAAELDTIMRALPGPKRRRTLLFSATLTGNLRSAKTLAAGKPFLFDTTRGAGAVTVATRQLVQNFAFVPNKVKAIYFFHLLARLGPRAAMPEQEDDDDERARSIGAAARVQAEDRRRAQAAGKAKARRLEANRLKLKAIAAAKGGVLLEDADAEDDDEDEDGEDDDDKVLNGMMAGEDDEDDEAAGLDGVPRAASAIIFAATCRMCQLLAETAAELGVEVVCLHSEMAQKRRMAALGKFRANIAKILIATDVAARGLDIPQVQLVVNFDVPQSPKDYVHRVGRTARAGRGGRSLTLITQFDVQLVHAVETYTGVKLTELRGVNTPETEAAVLRDMRRVTTAQRVARLRLSERGWDESLSKRRRQHAQRREKEAKFATVGETKRRRRRAEEQAESKRRRAERKRRRLADEAAAATSAAS